MWKSFLNKRPTQFSHFLTLCNNFLIKNEHLCVLDVVLGYKYLTASKSFGLLSSAKKKKLWTVFVKMCVRTVFRWRLIRLDLVRMLMYAAEGALGVPSEVTRPNATFSTRVLSTALWSSHKWNTPQTHSCALGYDVVSIETCKPCKTHFPHALKVTHRPVLCVHLRSECV